jgi:hypothetical protein
LLDSYKAQIWTPNHNIHKSDAFSLGLIMIETGLLENLDSLYNYDNCTFKQDLFQAKLQQFKEKYSGMLATLIDHMVELDEAKRLDFLGLFEKVRSHQNHAREERALKVINDTQAVDSRGLNNSSSKPNKPNESKNEILDFQYNNNITFLNFFRVTKKN